MTRRKSTSAKVTGQPSRPATGASPSLLRARRRCITFPSARARQWSLCVCSQWRGKVHDKAQIHQCKGHWTTFPPRHRCITFPSAREAPVHHLPFCAREAVVPVRVFTVERQGT